ncbi:MAG: DUF11 domain-containing protein, partial [Ardenticatenales bacterium]|nr:DUF11 domain-containing protein [Ardenticatenales bacterium]
MSKRICSQYLKREVPIGVVLTLLLGLLLLGREMHWLNQAHASEVAHPTANLLAASELGRPATAQNPTSGTCQLNLIPITNVTVGISNQPAINERGDRLGFWSTANISSGGSKNPDGNIEIFLSKVGGTFSQVTNSKGSILGGFNLSPSMDSTGTKVVFFSDRDLVQGKNTDSNFEIFLAQVATNGAVTITQITETTGGANILPSVSEKGNKIAFISDRDLTGTTSNNDKNLELFLADVTTINSPVFTQVTHTTDGLNDQPAISADGNSIAFVSDLDLTGQQSNSDGNLEIFRADVTTPSAITMRQITSSTNRTNDSPSIDGPGAAITFVADSGTGGRYQVWRVSKLDEANSISEVINATITVSSDAHPSISDDGTRVIFASESSGATKSRLYLYDSILGGLLVDPITGTTGDAEQPAISGSGANIVFISDHIDGRRQVYLAECPLAEVSIEKTTTKTEIFAGDRVTYTLKVMNEGPSTAFDVVALDTLPTKLTAGTLRVDHPDCSLSGYQLTCNLGDMLADAVETITVSGDLGPLERIELENTATVTSNTYDRDITDNTSTSKIPIIAQVTLGITKIDTPDPVVAGEALKYTIVVNNTGFSTAKTVQLVDTLDSNFKFSAVSSTPEGNCTRAGLKITCEWATLASNESATVTISGTVNSAARDRISNTAKVTAEEDTTGVEARATTKINTRTALTLTKTDSPDPVIAGQPLTYTLVAKNNGPSTATFITLTDILPANFNSPVATPSQGSCSISGTTISGTTLTCALGILDPTKSAIVRLNGQVAPLARGILSNTATVVSKENATGVTVTQDTDIQTQADLILTKTDFPDPVIAGEDISYTLNITNNGPSTAVGVRLTDTFSSKLTFATATTADGTCSISGVVMTCDLDNLGPGSPATVLLSGIVNASARSSLSNTATVMATDDDPDTSTNTATVSTIIQTSADLGITKSDTPDPVIAGETLTYTLSVINNGSSTATSVTVVDTLPDDVNGPTISSTEGNCDVTGTTATCDTITLLPGEQVTITIAGTVDIGARGSLVNTATVSGTEPDLVSSNDTATATTIINTEVDLQITKSASPDPVTAGETLTYNLTVTND